MAETVKNWDDVVVVGHHDADGIAATAIAVQALREAGKEVTYINLKQLYSDDVEEIQNRGEHFVFVDMGAGQLEFLVESMEKPFVILDHHRISVPEYPFLFHPSHAGVQGDREVSGAGMAYLFAKAMTGKRDTAHLAVVGAVGDVQMVNGELTGVNREILGDAISTGKIFAYRDLSLYGRSSRPLPYMLLYSTSPFLPGLTANEDACFRFLAEAGIRLKEGERWRSYVDLTDEEKRAFVSALVEHLLKSGWSVERAMRIIGEVYELPDEAPGSPLYDAREFATLLNAAGRHGRPEIGVEVCLGDREEKYREALALLSKHRKILREGIEFVLENGVMEGRHVYYFHAGEKIPSQVVGIVAGMVYSSGLVSTDRPIIAFAYEDGSVKVSARATEELVKKGVDLSEAVTEAAKSVGGEAGGHKPAAGARIPKGTEDDFVEKIDEIIGRQLGGRA